MNNDTRFDGLRKRLEQLQWPADYLFKFIVPVSKADELIEILPGEEFKTKKSEQGNYISITSYTNVSSEDEVIDVYVKAARIEGVISL